MGQEEDNLNNSNNQGSNPYPTNNYQQPPPAYQPPAPAPYQPAPPSYQSAGYQSPPPQQQQQHYVQQPYGYPPQQTPYGYQDPALMQANGAVIVGVAPIMEQRPMVQEDFGEQLRKLPNRIGRMFSKPSLATFEDLKLHASWGMTFALLTFQILFGMVLAAINWKIAMNTWHAAYDNNDWPYTSSDEKNMEPVVGAYIGYSILSNFLSFFIINGLFHGVALCLGGGSYNNQPKSTAFLQLCFLSALFGAPLDVLSLVNFIPWFGWITMIAIFVVRLIFFVLTLRAVYGITTGHAIGIIICFIVIFIVVMIVLAFTVAVTFTGILFAALN